MTGLDIFAIIVLLVLLVAIVGIWVVLAIMPGRIARSRDHPQAEAVNVCGWWGAITLGILMPLAYIWAYYRPKDKATESERPAPTETAGDATAKGAAS